MVTTEHQSYEVQISFRQKGITYRKGKRKRGDYKKQP